jgi:anaerobic dimethyl sulfoxide reductase subunit C (anchor subunit)
MEHYFSLLLFTFTGQTAVGLILIRPMISNLTISHPHAATAVRSDHLVSALLLVSLTTAFFHLGSPFRAVYALSNITHSPLSMEIASLSFLLALSVAISWFTYRRTNDSFRKILQYISVAAAIVLLLTMTSVYMLPSVPSWFTINTPLAFVLTTISAGSAVAAMMLFRTGSSVALRMMAIAVGSSVIMLIAGFVAGRVTFDGLFLLSLVYVLTVLAAFVLILSIVLWPEMNKSYRMTVITGIVVLLSGLIARLMFFLSYDNTIL